MAAWRPDEPKARPNVWRLWLDPLAAIAVVVAGLVLIALLLPAGPK